VLSDEGASAIERGEAAAFRERHVAVIRFWVSFVSKRAHTYFGYDSLPVFPTEY
jgi:hypothetical protein